MYTDKQINDFLEIAQEAGIGRARRELGYPKSWATGQAWAKARGVEVATDEIRQRVKSFDQWYETEDIVLTAQEGIHRVYEELTTNNALTAEDQKKLSEAFNKHYQVWANAKGKATTITESRSTDTMDEHIEELLAMERAKNKLKETSPSES